MAQPSSLAWLLANQLSAASRSAGLHTMQGPGLRLSPALALTPDVAVGHFRDPAPNAARAVASGAGATTAALRAGALTTPTADARFGALEVTLVADVALPGRDADGRAAHYAEAGINWFLLAEPDSLTGPAVTLRLLRREGSTFTRHTTARPGQTLTSRHPFPLAIRTVAD
jgi:hypothetical protein